MSSNNDNEFTRHIFLEGISPKFGALLISVTADILSEGLTASQINVLGTFTAAVGDTLSYIAAQMQFNQEILAADSSTENNNSNSSDQSNSSNDSSDQSDGDDDATDQSDETCENTPSGQNGAENTDRSPEDNLPI